MADQKLTGKKLAGRVALVTGASRGIGAAVAKAYARAGAHVILLARTVSGLEEVDDAIRAIGGQATLIPFDLKKIDDLEALGPLIDNRFGKLDILVANAGILTPLTPLAHTKIKDFQESLTVAATANLQLIRTLDPLLRASPAGRVIFVVSDHGRQQERPVTPYWGSYAVSQAALMMLARSYAAESDNTNLRVNMVSPGLIDTDLLRQAFPGGYRGSQTQPDDIAPVFVDLATIDCSRHGDLIDLGVN